MRHHIVLVGLPGSGKTTVGRLVARELGAELRDLDLAIEAKKGVSIGQIFSEHGEAEFRRMEREVARAALARSPAVVVPGGGWASQPGNLDQVPEGSLTIYLETSPETAAARVDPTLRPLLTEGRAEDAMRRLYEARKGAYGRCGAVVNTEGRSAGQVAREVVELARNAAVG